MKSNSTFFKTTSLLLFFLSINSLAWNQAPQWLWNSPIAVVPSTIGGAGISAYAMIDRPGSIYYVAVLHGSSGQPSNAHILAGQDSLGNTPAFHGFIVIGASDYKSGFKSIEMRPLTASNEYDLYFLAKDTATIPHIQSSPSKLDVIATPGSGLTFWNGDFEQWTDSLYFPKYFYNWRQTLTDSTASYTRALGESGYGFKTTVKKASSGERRVLIMNPDPYPFGLLNSTKYHVSLRLKASRANAFSAVFKSFTFFTDFNSGSGSGTITTDTLKNTNWQTYSTDFNVTSANRFYPRWNINMTATAVNGDNVIIDNFYIKRAADAPLWWNAYPVISNVKFNKFDVSVKLDEPGMVFYVLVPKDATAPSVAEVLAGTASGGSAALTNGSINVTSAFDLFSTTLTGLAEKTNYDLYLVAQNKETSVTNQSTVTKLSALTADFPGPFAKAGGNIWAISGYTVQLDGTGSIGTNLTYNWNPGAIILSSNTASKPTFTAPSITDTVVYPIILVVQDSINMSPPDTAFIHVVQDYLPIANGGGNKTVDPASAVKLDGSASHDPNGKTLTFSWTIPSGITVNKTDTAIIDFVAPSPLVKTIYKFVLVVNDGKQSSADTVLVTVKKFNIRPTADAGNDQTVNAAALVKLNGNASSDPNGDTLSFHWTIPPGITVSKTDTAIISFIAPSTLTKKSYIFILVVNDGLLNSIADSVVINVNAFNVAPTANAGADQVVDAGTQVVLSGSLSSDPNGDTLSYKWTLPNGILVSNTDTIQISFIAPSPVNTTIYPFILVVNDGKVNSVADTVLITVHGTVGIHSPVVQDIQLYPNPVNSSLNIKLSSNWTPGSTIRIFNAIGNLTLERKMNGNEDQFDLSSLAQGVYFIEIKDGQNSVTRKFIKR